VPERTGPAGALGYRLPVKAEALQALSLDGSPRRAFSSPSSHEMTLGRFRSRRQPSGAFGSDLFAGTVNGLNWLSHHCLLHSAFDG
jgi:hypothetical protein